MSRAELVIIPISNKSRNALATVEKRHGINGQDIVTTLIHWLASKDVSDQATILNDPSVKNCDLSPMFSELDDIR